MIPRSVREWDYIELEEPGPGAFTRREADRLVDIARATHLGGDDGERILVNYPSKLRAQQVVGIIAAPGVSLEILPKIDGAESNEAVRRNLVHMLAAVYELPIAEGNLTQLGWQRHDLLEIVIRIFIDHLFEAVHKGMPRRYVGHEDDVRALRGRLDLVRQFTILTATPQKLACRFDELSPDIALNQIMKAAVRRLMSISRAPENQRRLAELLLAFDDVRDVAIRALPWNQVILDRTNSAWAQLLNLAKLLLGDRFQSTSSGETEGFSLLFEMNTLFEEFVGRALKRALAGTQYRVRLQGPQNYALAEIGTGKHRFATRPDIVISDANGPVLIIDTKWKRLKGAIDDPKQGVGQSDVYQMMAYSQVYRCPRVMLLYPHHPPLGQSAGQLSVHEIVGAPGNQVCVASLSLKDPKRVPHELRGLLSGGFAELKLPLALAA